MCLDACAAVFEGLFCGKSNVPTGVEQGVPGILDRVGTDIELTVCGNDTCRMGGEFILDAVDDTLLRVVGRLRLSDPSAVGGENR